MKTVYDHIKSRHKLTNMYVCAGFSVYETPHGELTVVTAGNMINVTEDSKGKVQVLERLPTKTSERGRACRRIVPLPNSTISLRVENSPFFYQVDQQTAQDASMGGYPLPNFRDILPHTSSKRIEVTPTLKDMVEHAIEAGPIRGRSRYWGIIQPNDAIQSL